MRRESERHQVTGIVYIVWRYVGAALQLRQACVQRVPYSRNLDLLNFNQPNPLDYLRGGGGKRNGDERDRQTNRQADRGERVTHLRLFRILPDRERYDVGEHSRRGQASFKSTRWEIWTGSDVVVQRGHHTFVSIALKAQALQPRLRIACTGRDHARCHKFNPGLGLFKRGGRDSRTRSSFQKVNN